MASASFWAWCEKLSVARLFSYTRLLEQELERARTEHAKAQAEWKEREAALLDRLLNKHGVRGLSASEDNTVTPPAPAYKTPRQREVEAVKIQQKKLEALYTLPTHEEIKKAVSRYEP